MQFLNLCRRHCKELENIWLLISLRHLIFVLKAQKSKFHKICNRTVQLAYKKQFSYIEKWYFIHQTYLYFLGSEICKSINSLNAYFVRSSYKYKSTTNNRGNTRLKQCNISVYVWLTANESGLDF